MLIIYMGQNLPLFNFSDGYISICFTAAQPGEFEMHLQNIN